MSEEDILIRISNAEMMGRVAERERIIKLLEKHDSIISRCCIQPVCCLDADELIALIKGKK